MTNERTLLTTLEAAPRLGCQPSTLKLSRHSGSLFGVTAPPYVQLGRAVRYRPADLDEWLKQFHVVMNTAAARQNAED